MQATNNEADCLQPVDVIERLDGAKAYIASHISQHIEDICSAPPSLANATDGGGYSTTLSPRDDLTANDVSLALNDDDNRQKLPFYPTDDYNNYLLPITSTHCLQPISDHHPKQINSSSLQPTDSNCCQPVNGDYQPVNEDYQPVQVDCDTVNVDCQPANSSNSNNATLHLAINENSVGNFCEDVYDDIASFPSASNTAR